MVEEGPEKKRRSRFDVLPTEQPVPQQPESNSDATSLASTTQQHHIFNPSSGINGLGYEPSLDSQIASWYQLPAPLQSESVLPDFLKAALANITRVNGEGNPSDGQPYVSVIDVRFKNRLERAMEKNLSYIER